MMFGNFLFTFIPFLPLLLSQKSIKVCSVLQDCCIFNLSHIYELPTAPPMQGVVGFPIHGNESKYN